MKVCPTTHPREQLDTGFFILPVSRPLLWHDPPRPAWDGFNGSQRDDHNPNYRWGDPETLIGHEGCDLGSKTGNSVVAAAAGRVWYVRGDVGAAGVQVAIAHTCPECGGWFLTRYLHLISGSVTVKVGDLVTQGQFIGRSDSTGNAGWPHVHYETRHSTHPDADKWTWVYPGSWGTPYDPLAWGILEDEGTLPDPGPIDKIIEVTVNRPQLRMETKPYVVTESVKDLQALLAVRGYIASDTFNEQHQPDGKFGPGTEAALKEYQSDNGLTVDGIAGTESWDSLLDY